MPPRPTLEQRLAWHREHAGACGCRPPPPQIAALVALSAPQGADRPSLAQTVAVDERLQCRLMRSVMVFGPERMRLVKRTVVEDDIMDGAGGNKDAALHAGFDRFLEELKRSHEIGLEESRQIGFGATYETGPVRPQQGRVNQRVNALYQFASVSSVAELAR